MTLEFLEGFGLIENKRNLFAGEVFNSEQVFQALQHFFPLDTVVSGPPRGLPGTRSHLRKIHSRLEHAASGAEAPPFQGYAATAAPPPQRLRPRCPCDAEVVAEQFAEKVSKP